MLKEINKSLDFKDILTVRNKEIYHQNDKLSLIYQKSKKDKNISLN